MLIKISKELYSKEIIFKTCYKFTDTAYIHLSTDDDDYIVDITSKEETDTTDYHKEFANQLIEEVNRQIVYEETKNIRQILFARSLASTVIYDEEKIDIDTEVSDKTAMKDWFKNE